MNEMSEPAVEAPASLRVFRYLSGEDTEHTVIGDDDAHVSHDILAKHAHEALERDTFVCYAISDATDLAADELCFVPRGDRCEILSIRTNGWRRHHGDHRRSLVEILNDLAAAVACGRLHMLDRDELAAEISRGTVIIDCRIRDAATLAGARSAVDTALQRLGFAADQRKQVVLCVSEATTNLLLHGGGSGKLTVRRLPDRLRVIVADSGPGLNFFNWIEPPSEDGPASMGYGYKIILENLDEVSMHTGASGTTLILDRTV
jgi:anti-sigma regulatory factor (Ser/Thr protein kinase)